MKVILNSFHLSSLTLGISSTNFKVTFTLCIQKETVPHKTTAHQFLVELSYSFFRPQILKVEPSCTAELTVHIKVLLKSFQLKGDITKAMNFKEPLNRPAPANTPLLRKTFSLIVASPPGKKSGRPSNS